MGKLKDEWIDQMVVHNAIWNCPNCDSENVTSFIPPAIDLTSDKARDMSAADNDEFECESCDTRYDSIIYNSLGGVVISMSGKDGIDILVDVEVQDAYEEWEPSDSPHDEFQIALEGLFALMSLKSPSKYDDQLLNRLIFTNIITSLETFLKDTLLKLVEDDKSIQLKFYQSEKDMKNASILVSNILIEPSLPLKHLKNHLKLLTFHNLPKVNELYKLAIGKSIFIDKAHMELLCKAVSLRHICVHSNGKDEEGANLDDFTESYLRSVADAANRLVHNVIVILGDRFFDNLPKTSQVI